MKKGLIISILLILFSTFAFAQNTDKETFNRDTKKYLYDIFEKTLESIRVDVVKSVYDNMAIWDSTTILSGTSITDVIDLSANYRLISIEITSAWDAADITFQVSSDGVNFKDYYTTKELTYPGGTGNRIIGIIPSDFAGIRYLKIRSGTSATPVNQSNDEVLKYAKRLY